MLCPLQRPRRDRAQERHGLHGQRRRYRRNAGELDDCGLYGQSQEYLWPLVETDFSLSGGTARGVAGASEAALLNGVFWGSTQDGVSETLPDSKAFASLDQSGFEAAIAEMNDAIAASMMAQLVQVGYTYDTSLEHPVLTGAR